MTRDFDHEAYPEPATYIRCGRRVLLDSCRRVLVPATPEEKVRQKFVMYLQTELRVPACRLSTEDSLAHFSRGSKGRADIVVKDQNNLPLLVAECKRPGIQLGHDVLEQAIRYHKVIAGRSEVVVLTNGCETRWYRLDSAGVPQRLACAPRYEELLNNQFPDVLRPEPKPIRTSALEPTSSEEAYFLDQGILGEGSPHSNRGYLGNIAGLFYLDPAKPIYRGVEDNFRIEETGNRETVFGNAAGGTWGGVYRYFLITDKRGEAQVISMTILGKNLAKNDPKFGNMNGHTIFIVAVDDGERSHNSLQLDLDKYVEVGKETITIWHDGRLTIGKKGSAKRSDVLAFIKRHQPLLVVRDRILLGNLPRKSLISWSSAEDFIYRSMLYALVRDQFRSTFG